MGGESGVDCWYHVILILLIADIVLLGWRVLVLVDGCEVGHGQQGAVRRRLWVVWDVHAAEMTSTGMSADVISIYDVTVGENVSKHALWTELAVPL